MSNVRRAEREFEEAVVEAIKAIRKASEGKPDVTDELLSLDLNSIAEPEFSRIVMRAYLEIEILRVRTSHQLN